MSQKDLDVIVDKVVAFDPNKPAEPLKVIAGAQDRPLGIGDIEIPCYVLEDETRVLSQRGLQTGLGMGLGGARTAGARRIGEFVEGIGSKGINIKDLMVCTSSPIEFQPPHGGRTALAFPATVLVDLCDVVLEARRRGVLYANQQHIAIRAETLMRGLATVGIIALVDEATGYQRVREERALATILEQFIAKELQPWTRTFPFEFYEHICRLRGWPSVNAARRPAVIGRYTNDFVYDRLAPGVLDGLKKINPVTPAGYRRHKHHQWFTPDIGHPKLQQHLAGVIALMRVSSTWGGFKRLLQKAYPKVGDMPPLDFDGD